MQQDKLQLYPKKFHLLTTLLGILALLLCAGAFYVSDFFAGRELNRRIDEIDALNRNTARIVEENVRLMLAQANHILLMMKLEVEEHGAIRPEYRNLLAEQLTLPFFDQFSVADKEGNVTYSAVPLTAPLNIAAREHFRVQIAADNKRLYIAPPWISRATGVPNIFLSRRVNDGEGNFAGMVGVGLRQEYLASVYSTLELNPDHVILLLRQDGEPLARVPDSIPIEQLQGLYASYVVFGEIARGQMTGTYGADSPSDGVYRMAAYRAMDDYPLVVLVGVSKAAALQPTLERLQIYRVFARLSSVLALVILFLIWMQIRDHFQAARLQQQEAATALQRREEEVKYLSLYDPLTKLLNRNALRQLVSRSQNGRAGQHSVIYLDIDNFRLANDAFGHAAADRLLADLAAKMENLMTGRGQVYRHGGDEFVFVLDATAPDTVQELAAELQRSVSRQLTINERVFFLTASIGISIGAGQISAGELLQQAYTALYIAKKDRNRIVIYTPDMDQARLRESILANDMRDALEKGQFELYYQPILAVKDGAIRQAEALIRWNHPQFGCIPPAEFIPIAEETKLIIPISEWVIRQACNKVAEWRTAGLHDIVVSANLSLAYFDNHAYHLPEFVREAIQQAGITSADLKLEITETVLMSDPDYAVGTMQILRDYGVSLAIDDFGSGYASFQYLRDLPIQTIKLDRSLISDIDSNPKGRMIVQAMINIIHGLHLETVAEGVETEEQFRYLKECGCDHVQGFLFSRPLPADEFAAYCRAAKGAEQSQ